jgi:hypothetical protein
MRGFRFVGPASLASMNDFAPSDLLFFSPHIEGGLWRTGCIRARDFDLFLCQTHVAMGACPDDYVFVATAIGEGAFRVEDSNDATESWKDSSAS